MEIKTNYNLKDNKEVNYQKGLKLILTHFRKHIGTFILITILLLIANIALNVISPYLTKIAIDENIVNKDLAALIQTSLFFILNTVIIVFANFLRIKTTGIFSQKILFEIREKIFKKIQNLPARFFSDNQTGDIIQRLTGNVEGINNFFSEGLVRILDISFSLSVIAFSMLYENWQLALIPITGGILTLIFIVIQGRIIEKPISESLDKEADLSSTIQESLDGFVAIQADNQQDTWVNRFKERNLDFFKIAKKVALISSTSDSFLIFTTYTSMALTLIFSLKAFSDGIITLGTVVIFLTYVQRFFRRLDGISQIWNNIKIGISSAERLSDVLELDNDITTKKKPYSPTKINGDIEFVDVDFSYSNNNEKVLSDVNFKADAGKTIAIVGPTGGGKTTFVNLIARLYDVDNGNIKVDDNDVKDWDLDCLRNSIGYLIQDNFLFEDTVLNNLRYDNESVTKKKAEDMFKFLGAEKLLESLPKGLNTKLEAEGENLSAGQRQIVALARILLRDPRILILDEATARIDTKSEKMLQNAIEIASKDKTTFIIAHRLSTIFNADRIILIKDNTILEQGTHDELIKQKCFYFEMYSRFVGEK